jgi:hypothetical protein
MENADGRGGQDQNWNPHGLLLVCLHHIEVRSPVHVRHHDVQDDELGRWRRTTATPRRPSLARTTSWPVDSKTSLCRCRIGSSSSISKVRAKESPRDVGSGSRAQRLCCRLRNRYRTSDAEDMANLYFVTRADGAEEIAADFYERKGEEWAFVLSGTEVYRIKIDDVVSVAKAPRDLE